MDWHKFVELLPGLISILFILTLLAWRLFDLAERLLYLWQPQPVRIEAEAEPKSPSRSRTR